jgi:hypothetical protein
VSSYTNNDELKGYEEIGVGYNSAEETGKVTTPDQEKREITVLKDKEGGGGTHNTYWWEKEAVNKSS